MRAMKDSGIPWLGQIPEQWVVSPMGQVFREVNSPNSDLKEDNALQFKLGEIVSKKEGNSKYTPETLEAYNVVKPGTIMINGLNLSFDFISQRVALVKEKGVITSTYLAIYPCSHVKSDFAKFLLKAYDNCKALHAMGRGLRATLSYSTFRSEFFLLPPLPEQERIAEYLDGKCAEIDELIGVEEQMIAELQAYKQSIITETVTKGLNPDNYLPQTSTSCILKNLVKISTGEKDANHGNENGCYDFFTCALIPIKSDTYSFEGESLILPGNGANVGEIIFYRGRFEAYQRTYVLQAKSDINLRYIYWHMTSNWSVYNKDKLYGSAIPYIKYGNLAKYPICFPPLPEQQAIAEYLDGKCEEIDALVEVKRRKIEELKEYKKSVIYEYVTGKREIA